MSSVITETQQTHQDKGGTDLLCRMVNKRQLRLTQVEKAVDNYRRKTKRECKARFTQEVQTQEDSKGKLTTNLIHDVSNNGSKKNTE